jgi:FkbM family methyltransferase
MSNPIHARVQDAAFNALSKQKDKVFFIQIGAADGIRADPIHPFVKRYGWHGILVEPLADLFQLLKNTYRDHKGLMFENVAITDKEETRLISRIPLDMVGQGDIPPWAFGASTLVPNKTLYPSLVRNGEMGGILSSAVTEEPVQCISLSTLINRHRISRLDVLQIDTEGYDAQILKQLDFSLIKPTLINMEWQWLSPTEQNEITEILKQNGYSLYPCDGDLLASTIPLEQLISATPKPLLNNIPHYFPGVITVTGKAMIDTDNGGISSQQIDASIIHYGGLGFSFQVHRKLYMLLMHVDGKQCYREIAELVHMRPEQVLISAQQLIDLHILQ